MFLRNGPHLGQNISTLGAPKYAGRVLFERLYTSLELLLAKMSFLNLSLLQESLKNPTPISIKTSLWGKIIFQGLFPDEMGQI